MKVEYIYRTLTAYEVAEAVKQRTRRRVAFTFCVLAFVGLVVWAIKG